MKREREKVGKDEREEKRREESKRDRAERERERDEKRGLTRSKPILNGVMTM